MKPVMRYQSQLLFRKSYKPNRVIRIRPTGRRNLLFRSSRADPDIEIYGSENQLAEIRGSNAQLTIDSGAA